MAYTPRRRTARCANMRASCRLPRCRQRRWSPRQCSHSIPVPWPLRPSHRQTVTGMCPNMKDSRTRGHIAPVCHRRAYTIPESRAGHRFGTGGRPSVSSHALSCRHEWTVAARMHILRTYIHWRAPLLYTVAVHRIALPVGLHQLATVLKPGTVRYRNTAWVTLRYPGRL